MIYQGVEYIAVQGKKCIDCAFKAWDGVLCTGKIPLDDEVSCTMDKNTVWHKKGYEAPTQPPFDTKAQIEEYLLNPENHDKIHGHSFCPISRNACSINCPGYKQPGYKMHNEKWVVVIGRCDSPMLVRDRKD